MMKAYEKERRLSWFYFGLFMLVVIVSGIMITVSIMGVMYYSYTDNAKAMSYNVMFMISSALGLLDIPTMERLTHHERKAYRLLEEIEEEEEL